MLPAEFCLPRLLEEWETDGATGTLKALAPAPSDEVTTLLVEGGRVVFATTRSRSDPTGELFLELFQPSPDPDDPDEVERLRDQVVRVVGRLLTASPASVRFQEGITLSRWPRVDLSTADLLLRALRQVSDETLLASWVGPPERPYRARRDLFSAFTAQPTPEEAFVLSRFDGIMSVRELLALGGTTPVVTLRVVCALLYSGAVAPVGEPSARRARPAVTRPLEPPSDVVEAARYWCAVEAKLEAIRAGADHYEVLGVPRRAGAQEVEAAYARLSGALVRKELCLLAPAELDAARQVETVAAALRVARDVLASPDRRAAYDAALAAGGHAASTAPLRG